MQRNYCGFALVVVLTILAAVTDGQTVWQAGAETVGSWWDARNWSGGVPTGSLDARINNGGTAEVSAGSAVVKTLHVGPGDLLVEGGELNATTADLGGSGTGGETGSGAIVHSDGVVRISYLWVGNSSGGAGDYTLSGGGKLYVGTETLGPSHFAQLGGTHSVSSFIMAKSPTISGRVDAVYDLAGGSFIAGSEGIGANGRATFNQGGGINHSTGEVEIGSGSGSSGIYNLSGDGARFDATGLTLGADVASSGTLNQTAGQVYCQALWLGKGAYSAGIYNLSGNAVLSVSGGESLGGGAQSSASFDQSGGVNHAYSGIEIAGGKDSSGTYALNAGTVVCYTLTVGKTGTGSFVQTGGVAGVTSISPFSSTFNLGYDSGASGSYLLSGDGQLNTGSQGIGYGSSSIGTFKQDGGSNRISGVLYLGYGYRSVGNYSLAGELVSGSQYVGYGSQSRAKFTQSGGSNDLGAAELQVAVATDSVGSYLLSGDQSLLVSGTETVGYGGIGTFVQSGGINQVGRAGSSTAFLYIARQSGASGSYTLSGGQLVAGTEYVGYGAGSLGTFTQSGGSNTTSGKPLFIASGLGATGTYNLSGGTLNTGDQSVGANGNGTIYQSGGTNTVNGTLSLGSDGGTYFLSGGSLYATTGESVAASGVFRQSGGSNTAGALTIAKNGRYELSGGSLVVSTTFNNLGALIVDGTAPASLAVLNATFDLAHNVLLAPGKLSVMADEGSTLILPAGFDPGRFAAYSNLGMTHTMGSGVMIVPAGKTVSLWHDFADAVDVSGTLKCGNYAALTGGTIARGSGSITAETVVVQDAGSGVFDKGNLAAHWLYVGGTADGAGAAGIYTVSEGAWAAISGTATVWGPGTLVVAGGSLNASLLRNDGSFIVSGSKAALGVSYWPKPVTGTGSTAIMADADVTVSGIEQGVLSVSGRLTTSGGAVSAVSSLVISGGGVLDLCKSGLVIDYATASPAESVRQWLLAGRNGGTWDGSGGIVSSDAAWDTRRIAAIGYGEASEPGLAIAAGGALDASAVVLKYTIYGDADLDGKITAGDYARIDRGYARHAAGAQWTEGDFNYDGVVDSADYLLIDSTFIKKGQTLSPEVLAAREAEFGAGYVAALTAAVPEPSGLLGAAGVVGLAVGRGRRGR